MYVYVKALFYATEILNFMSFFHIYAIFYNVLNVYSLENKGFSIVVNILNRTQTPFTMLISNT